MSITRRLVSHSIAWSGIPMRIKGQRLSFASTKLRSSCMTMLTIDKGNGPCLGDSRYVLGRVHPTLNSEKVE